MSLVELLDDARAFLYASSPGAAATSVRDLFAGVPSTPALIHPLVPFLAVVFYLLSKPALSAVCARLGTTGRSPAFRAAALAHNALLASYSLWTAWHVVPLAVARVREHGVDDLYCGTGMWDDVGATKGLGFWAYLFYISKMYEVVDTYVLVVKRREPSYLQVYHHVRPHTPLSYRS